MADLKEAACAAHRLEEVDVQMWEHHAGRYYGEQPMCARPDKVLGQEPQAVLHRQSIMLLEKARGPLCCCHHDNPQHNRRYLLLAVEAPSHCNSLAARGLYMAHSALYL